MKTIAIALLGLLFAGCVQQMPLISHAHMGHSLTAWHDTPDNEALLIVAEKELAIALAESSSLVRAPGTEQKRAHFRNVVHALNPDMQMGAAGLGYGAIRALQGTVDHLEYATQSPDASDNLITSVAELVGQGDAIVRRLDQSLQLAIAGVTEADEQVEVLGVALYDQLRLAVGGELGIASTLSETASGEIGIRGLHQEMQAMLQREVDPSYEPLARRYVLGLVRLPNGAWGYQLPKRKKSFSSYGYGSYSY